MHVYKLFLGCSITSNDIDVFVKNIKYIPNLKSLILGCIFINLDNNMSKSISKLYQHFSLLTNLTSLNLYSTTNIFRKQIRLCKSR